MIKIKLNIKKFIPLYTLLHRILFDIILCDDSFKERD